MVWLLNCPSRPNLIVCPREVEENGFIIGFKPVGSEDGTGSLEQGKGFPDCFDFVIAYPVVRELAFLSIDLILENFFNFSFFLS